MIYTPNQVPKLNQTEEFLFSNYKILPLLHLKAIYRKSITFLKRTQFSTFVY